MQGHTILVIEQADFKPFNRGKLLNVGVLQTVATHFVCHDVDMIPLNADYTAADGVTQLADSQIQINGYLGGVTMFDRETFYSIGGYNNDYFHRAEDNEMAFNIHRLRLKVTYRIGRFAVLPHARTGPEFDPSLWYKSQQPRKVQNQLASCQYEITSDVVTGTYRHIKVML